MAIRKVCHKLMKSYFGDRRFFIEVGNKTLAEKRVNVGLPKGSTIGPL